MKVIAMKTTNGFEFNIGDIVTTNVNGHIGTGEILKREQDNITNLNHYYVQLEFENNCKNNMCIYESDLVKVSSNLKSMCEKYNVDYQNALSCLLENPELTDKQIITQYRPDLSINIFGDIIEPDKTE